MKNSSEKFAPTEKPKTIVRAKKRGGAVIVEINGVKIGGLSASAEAHAEFSGALADLDKNPNWNILDAKQTEEWEKILARPPQVKPKLRKMLESSSPESKNP